jgi:hypothetical protein
MLQQQLIHTSVDPPLIHCKPEMPNPADSGGSAGNTDDSCSTRGPSEPCLPENMGGGTSSESCEGENNAPLLCFHS